MLAEIAIGSLLLVITTIVHASAMALMVWQLRRHNAQTWGPRSYFTRTLVVSLAVLFLVIASLVEVTIWAGTYLLIGAMSELEPALYFSMVTFTTIGFGDIVLPPDGWRILSSFEAANGIVMFGWTTALIFFVVQRLYVGQGRE